MEELRYHFFGVVEGEVVVAAGGGEGLVGGASNGSGGGGPFFACGFRDVMVGGDMNFGGGMDGGQMVLGCLGGEGVD